MRRCRYLREWDLCVRKFTFVWLCSLHGTLLELRALCVLLRGWAVLVLRFLPTESVVGFVSMNICD